MGLDGARCKHGPALAGRTAEAQPNLESAPEAFRFLRH